jgi:glycosyltransferase involved in cell wall biosynthesis
MTPVDTPSVSIVLSVHNEERFLGECLESVLAQTGVSFEVIAIDDGSTDGSRAVLDAYSARDPRLRVVHQPSAGLTRALIRGCAMARGRFIARQDADDIAFPGRLARLAEELDAHPQVVLVASASVMFGPRGELLSSWAAAGGQSERDTSAHGSWMFRRDAYELVGGYRLHFRAAQDVDLRLRFERYGEVRVLPDVLYAWRIHEGQISAMSPIQKRLSRLAHEAAARRACGLDDSDLLAEAARLSVEHDTGPRSDPGTGDYFAGRCLVALGDRRAITYLWRACRCEPTRVGRWLALGQALVATRSSCGFDVVATGIAPRARSAGS